MTEPAPDMPEVSEAELVRRRWADDGAFAVYFYTPLCGTCKLGEKMLHVVRAIEPGAGIVKANVNFMPSIVAEWKIESVPCLAFVEGKRVTEKLYTLRSVENVLERVRTRLKKE